jgi:tetraprenyl-beta-curcumene synthase
LRARARAIPDPGLRTLALVTQREERGNLEGAAAFGVLVPRIHRRAVVRALVAFQATYDYIDTLAEQPCADPVANGRQLHLALLAALDPQRDHADYYEHSSGSRDNGYMRNLIETCRGTVAALPSYTSVLEPALRSARRMVTYQSLNHSARPHTRGALARWAAALTPADTELRWWETAAAGASSLTVFALIAAAAKPGLSAAEMAATEEAYFPSISALHVLLDSLIDRACDLEHGHHNLIDHYSSPAEAAHRLAWIAGRAVRGAEALPDGARHALIVAAMASFYLSAPSISTPATFSAAQRVQDSIGAPATPTMAVLKIRRAISGLLPSSNSAVDSEP